MEHVELMQVWGALVWWIAWLAGSRSCSRKSSRWIQAAISGPELEI